VSKREPITTLRMEVRPTKLSASDAAHAEKGDQVTAWQVFLGTRSLGVLYTVDSEAAETITGPWVHKNEWGVGEGDSPSKSRLASLMKEAAIAILESALDRSEWGKRIRLTRPDSRKETWHVDPYRVGFHRIWEADHADTWEFNPVHDCFGRTDGSNGVQGIVAAISGGGLRATGFALGVFSVLEELGACDQLKCVTSALPRCSASKRTPPSTWRRSDQPDQRIDPGPLLHQLDGLNYTICRFTPAEAGGRSCLGLGTGSRCWRVVH